MALIFCAVKCACGVLVEHVAGEGSKTVCPCGALSVFPQDDRLTVISDRDYTDLSIHADDHELLHSELTSMGPEDSDTLSRIIEWLRMRGHLVTERPSLEDVEYTLRGIVSGSPSEVEFARRCADVIAGCRS